MTAATKPAAGPAQTRLLRALLEAGGRARSRDLAAAMGYDGPNAAVQISGLAARAIESGWARRVQTGVYVLTHAGEAVAAGCRPLRARLGPRPRPSAEVKTAKGAAETAERRLQLRQEAAWIAEKRRNGGGWSAIAQMMGRSVHDVRTAHDPSYEGYRS